MKSKSQQRRVMKTGKIENSVTRFDAMLEKKSLSPTPFIITFYLYDDNTGISYLYEQSSFRTRALAEKALKKVKQVLKECQHG